MIRKRIVGISVTTCTGRVVEHEATIAIDTVGELSGVVVVVGGFAVVGLGDDFDVVSAVWGSDPKKPNTTTPHQPNHRTENQ